MRSLHRGFTLVELLLAVAVIGLLLAILLPSLGAAQGAARCSACLSQMRQIGSATLLYAHANKGRLPRSSHSALAAHVMPWGYALVPSITGERYLGPGPDWDNLFNDLYRCPNDPRTDKWSYGKNVWFELSSGETGELLGQANGPTYETLCHIPNHHRTILFGELASGSMGDHIMAHFWNMGGAPEVDMKRHSGQSNYVFIDGHAETLEFNTTFDLAAKIDLWDPGKAR